MRRDLTAGMLTVMEMNRQLVLKRMIHEGEGVDRSVFDLIETPIPEPADGQFLMKTVALGTSPAQRAYLMGTESKFHHPIGIGDVMRGRGVGIVTASRHPGYAPGDVVACSTGWQDYSIQNGDQTGLPVKTLQKVHHPRFPLHLHLGTLGASAFAAWYGLIGVGQPKAGETVVVSAAAGGVGSIAVQLAKIHGCRVIGIAGGKRKCDWVVKALGAEACIDYKAENVPARLDALCGDGIDVYFDNVGGATLDAVMARLAVNARIVICGLISTEYEKGETPGPAHYYNLIYKRARMEGFFVWDHIDDFPNAERRLAALLDAGKLIPTEDVLDGLEAAPDALQSLFTGDHLGIRVVRVAGDSSG